MSKKMENLKKKVKEGSAVAFEDYANEELTGKISNLLAFPGYIFKTLIMPLLLMIVLIIGIDIILKLSKKSMFVVFLFSMLALCYSFINALGLGIANFFRSLRNDFDSLLSLSLELTEKILDDAKGAKDGDNQASIKVAKVIQGVFLFIIFPVIAELISEKIPLLSKKINLILEKLVMSTVKEIDIEIDEEIELEEESSELIEGETDNTEEEERKLKKIRGKLKKVNEKSFYIVLAPIKFTNIIIFCVSTIIFMPLILMVL